MSDVDWVGRRFLFAFDHPFREPLEPFPDRLAFQRATVLLDENMQFARRDDDCSAEKSPVRSSVIWRRNATTPRLSQVKRPERHHLRLATVEKSASARIRHATDEKACAARDMLDRVEEWAINFYLDWFVRTPRKVFPHLHRSGGCSFGSFFIH
jgi:hypothetical protein